jgi:cold-inducible RNA-binding protein
MKLFIGNLSWDATEEELRNLFASVGEVVSVRIVQDQFTGRSKGFGFVEMKDSQSGQQAIDTLNDTPFVGRPIRISEARQKPQNSRGGGGGGGNRPFRPRGGPRGGQGGGGGGYGQRPYRRGPGQSYTAQEEDFSGGDNA